MPVVGTGIFDGDGPTEYLAKSKAVLRDLQLADARLAWATTRGTSFRDFTLDSIPAIMDAREEELRKQAIPQEQIDNILIREFGLT